MRPKSRVASSLVSPVEMVRVEAVRVIEQMPLDTCVPRLWSARALASRWGVSRQLFFKLHRLGRLRGFRIQSSSPNGKGALRFAEEDVVALLNDGRTPTQGAGGR